MKVLHSVAVVGLVFLGQHLTQLPVSTSCAISQVEQVKKLTGCVSQVTPSDHPFARSIIQKKKTFSNIKILVVLPVSSFDRLTTTQIHENIHILEGAKTPPWLAFFCTNGVGSSINSKKLKLAGHSQRAGSGKKSRSQVKRDGSLRVVCLEDGTPHLGYVVFVKGSKTKTKPCINHSRS